MNASRLPVVPRQQEPLCQAHGHSCAACCGLFNFVDRSLPALTQRLWHRTAAVMEAGWDEQPLTHAADALSTEESPLLLFPAVRTCPFAGFLDAAGTTVGCLIHPRRHPREWDLRDLGAFGNHEICAGHLCAPHAWLTAADKALLSCAPSWHAYSLALADSGFLKAVLAQVAVARGAAVTAEELEEPTLRAAAAEVLALWDGWEFADDNPRHSGGFAFAGDDSYALGMPGMGRFSSLLTQHEATMLDALGTRAEDESRATLAVGALRARMEPLLRLLV